ncbi:LuxR C-terminal-related transcriptional regulator [Streptomyces sp. NBC_01471]|uniref:LuxR C-terminal-related transcriptional regulator n=1 Tax=Streptomyces sp. NBC_01471 TaxID=2903879 RepID=UPI00324C9C3D
MTTTITPLTPAQKRAAELVIQGLSNSEIAIEGCLSPDTVIFHITCMRQKLNCPPHASRPVLAHALLLHRQVPTPSIPASRRKFTPNEDQQKLLKAIAEHSKTAGIARAAGIAPAGIAPADVKSLTKNLLSAAGVANSTQLVAWGHAMDLLGTNGQNAPGPSAARVGAAR